jgi:hypothetical protein
MWYLKNGADPNATSKGCECGPSPMLVAAREAPSHVVSLLVEHGGKIDSNVQIAPEVDPGRVQFEEYVQGLIAAEEAEYLASI